jgi:hypothetical protein
MATERSTAGCYFSLVLRTEVDGPSLMGVGLHLTEAKPNSGTFIWIGIFGSTYVLQEDKSGFGHCIGPWSATITPR